MGPTEGEEGGLGCDTNFWWWSNNIRNWKPVKHQRMRGEISMSFILGPPFSHPFLDILRILDTVYIVRDVAEAEGILSPKGHYSPQKSVGDLGIPSPPFYPAYSHPSCSPKRHAMPFVTHRLPPPPLLAPHKFFSSAYILWISICNCDWLNLPLGSIVIPD